MNCDAIIQLFENLYRKFCLFVMAVTATSLLPSLYFLKCLYSFKKQTWELKSILSIFIILGIPFILSYICLLWMKCQAKDSATEVKEIEPVNNEYLPIYLGYIFVSLSIPSQYEGQVDWIILCVIYILVVLFVSISQSFSFNPIFIVFGYGYYRITTNQNVKVFIVTKRRINKNVSNLVFNKLSKASELFYIDIES